MSSNSKGKGKCKETITINNSEEDEVEVIINNGKEDEVESKSKGKETVIIKSEDELKLNSNAKIQQLTEKAKVQDFFHSIHNYMRNNGIGYSMTALKIFSLFFGLMSIEEKPNCLKLLNFDDKYSFSNIIKRCKAYKADPSKADSIKQFIDVNLLDYLAKFHRNIFFVELTKEVGEQVLCDFILTKIFPLQKYIKETTNSNIQLSGKIYEYFIGREKASMSEFGAYFTDRYITIYTSLKSPIHIRDDGTIPYTIDMFGGSGGFTITNVENFLQEAVEKKIKVNWKREIKKIYHFDMNADVVKHAAFETFLLLEQMVNYKDNFRWANSFKDESFEILSKHTDLEVRTNPPYGGDSFDKQVGQISIFIKMINFIKGKITIILDDLYKLFDTKKYESTLTAKILKHKKYTIRKEYLKLFDRLDRHVKKHYDDKITENELKTYITIEIKPYFKSDITKEELNKRLVNLTKIYERKLGVSISIKNLEVKHKYEDTVSLQSSSRFIKNYTKIIKDYKSKFESEHKIMDKKLLSYSDPNDKEAVSLILLMASIQNGGRVVAVLKEGVFFNDTYRYLRAYLCCNFEVEYITSIDQKAFENTTTKTSIICFKHTGKPTTSIKFYELLIIKQEEDEIEFDEDFYPVITRHKGDIINFENKNVDEMEEFVSEGTFDELIKNEFNLQGKTYEKKLTLIPGDDFKMAKLEEICEFNTKLQNENNILKYVEIGDINNNQINDFKTYNKESIPNKSNTYVNNNNILICSVRPNTNKIVYINNDKYSDYCFTNAIHKLSNIKINSIYLYEIIKLYFNNNIFISNLCKRASSYPRFSIKELKKYGLLIPIPKTDELMEYWINKIEVPFNKMNEKEDKIKVLKEEIETEIKRIIDEEECIDTKLGDICDLQPTTKHYTSIGKTIGKYRFYSSSQDKKLYLDTYEIEQLSLIIGNGGNQNIHIGKEFTPSKHVTVINIKNDLHISVYYLYFYILNYNLEKSFNGSTMGWLNKEHIKKILIPIPKNTTVLKSLDPKFEKLEKVQVNYDKYKLQYEEALQELKTASIKSGLN
jgi:hypothetical protein